MPLKIALWSLLSFLALLGIYAYIRAYIGGVYQRALAGMPPAAPYGQSSIADCNGGDFPAKILAGPGS